MRAHLAPSLARLDARIEREILRLRARYQLSLDEFRGLYVSDEQVDQLLADAHANAHLDLAMLVDRPAAGAREQDARWKQLAESFSLSELDEDLLLIVSAPELDLKYEMLYAYLNNDVTRKWPTADLARRLLGDVASPAAVSGALAPAATLLARRLLSGVTQPAGRPSLLNRGFALHPCITHWLHGHAPSLALDMDATRWLSSAELPGFDDAAQIRAAPMVRMLERWLPESASFPIVALLGQPGSGRTSTAAAIAAATGRPLAQLDLQAAAQNEAELTDALEGLAVAIALVPAIVLIHGFDALAEEEPRRLRAETRLMRALARWPASSLVLFRTNDDERWRPCAGGRRIVEHRCELETFADRVAQWRDAARAQSIAVVETDLQSLAGRFAFSAGQVRATLATARDLAAMGDASAVGIEQIGTAARLTSDQALGRMATKVDRKHSWTDLVLGPTTVRRLHELTAAIRHRHVVFGQWGFGERIVNGLGVKALFAGTSGTGKTMAAGVIARELQLDLYKVDLSSLVSKYIGETEKNLDRIFRAARVANAIVFLDEAEAIMGKRSEVKDAHDRYANIEVAYLLQKLEEHDGIVILATNLKRNIDDAFSRRVQYVVEFPRPDEPERERIWRGMFPPRSPIGADVDFAFLARQFDLAGGDIRNVALDAAFLAAEDGGIIDMRVIVEAVSRQLAKQGKTLTGTEFRQYQGFVHSLNTPRNGS